MWDKIKNSKGFYIAISITFAIVCWFYVDITVEPDISVTVHNIPITYEGLDELEAKGLMIEDTQSSTVTLKLSGQRSTVSQLNRNNITVTVDAASQITGPGKQSLEYTVSFPTLALSSNVKIKSKSTTTIDVSVIRSSTKSVSVSGDFTGSVGDGYKEEGFELEYRLISVSGDQKTVDQIDHAVVSLDHTGLTTDWKGTLPVSLVDQNGKSIKTDQLTLSHSEMQVTLIVRKIKTLPLSVTFEDGGGATADDVSYQISPETITVSGTDEALDALNEWSLGKVDLAQVITSEKLSFDIALPKGMTCESGEETASVTVKLPKLKTIKMKTTNIQLTHVPKTKTATLLTKSIEVRIRGTEKVLDLLVNSDIYVVADLSDLNDHDYGTHTVPATVTLHGFTEVGAVGTYQLTVYLT